MAIIVVTDLPSALQDNELVSLMLAGANANAARVAPCLVDDDPAPSEGQLAEAKLVLIGAVKRWCEAGAGSLTQEAAGPFSHTIDTRQRTGYNLWPSEIERLQDICKGDDDDTGGAFSVDTAPNKAGAHWPWCSLYFNGTDCSCGVDIAGEPIFEG